MAQLGDFLVNSLGNSTTNRLDNRTADRIGDRLDNRLVNRLVNSPTVDRVVKTTATGVELKLSPTQQVGGIRRGVTDVASRRTVASAQKQSNLSHSSPSGKMRQASKYRLMKRPKESSTCTLT